jgi:alanyl-tRNA synthetase
MVSDKEIKKEFKKKASANPDKYYATTVLKKYGYTRKQCTKCNLFFWTTDASREVCGDSACSGGFKLFENNPCKHSLTYIEVWQKFSEMFSKLGYTPINRYPTVARWNPTADFVMASIAAFQPFVVSGEINPPAKKLVIPQFSIRFSDIENIGITASHQTGFVMIGQHMFVEPKEWDQDKVFEDIIKWLTDGLGLPFNEITFHEDAWAGGGNFGPCMEYFSRGVELGNQVYMMFEQTNDGYQELKLKVLDMGMGMERNAWFSQATPTQHHAVYPKVVNYLLEKTNLQIDEELMKKFIPLSGMLNIDEVDDIDKAWEEVAELLNIEVIDLKKKVLPISGLFSIADHCRTLLFTLCDGALPSNTGGGYNLRILIRRALSFIDKYNWDIKLIDVCEQHAKELKPIFPELIDSLSEVEKILEFEKQKYENTKLNISKILEKIKFENLNESKLIELYDSKGISPEMVIQEAKKKNKTIEMPSNFFGKVSELHEKKTQVHATQKEEKLNLENIENTKGLYFDDYLLTNFSAKVLKIIDNNVILDQTAFYPTSGGQLHDIGTINKIKVVDVFKQGSVIVHLLEEKPDFDINDNVKCDIDKEWRTQLTQHHTATHIVNLSARKLLGRHINQAGAKKTDQKAHLDITHFDALTQEDLDKIEEESNKIINQGLKINKFFMPRDEAEKKYGMSIYQGGAVPGKEIRLIDIGGIDIEACGGTHLNNTNEVGKIKILKSAKIQDGIVRLTYTAGNATDSITQSTQDLVSEASKILEIEPELLPARAKELFEKWKQIKKKIKKKKTITEEDFEFKSTEKTTEDILNKTATELNTQPEHVLKTINKFLSQLEEFKKDLN